MYSSGVTTSTDMIGSSSTGLAISAALRNAIWPAILNAISDESTSWYWPSTRRRLDVDGRVAGEHAGVERGLDALVRRLDVLARDAPAGDLVDELVALARVRLERDLDDGELARATGLLDVAVLDRLDGLGDRLAVGHLRLADGRLDGELALHAVDEHLEVQLAHARDDGLAGLLVGADAERRVLVGQRLERLAELVLVALRLRLDGDVDHRLRELHALEDDRVVAVAQRVAGGRVLEAEAGDDVAGHRPRRGPRAGWRASAGCGRGARASP